MTVDRHECHQHNGGSSLGGQGVCLHGHRQEHGDTEGRGWLLSWREPWGQMLRLSTALSSSLPLPCRNPLSQDALVLREEDTERHSWSSVWIQSYAPSPGQATWRVSWGGGVIPASLAPL